jgi:hypothetical protein
MTEPVAPALSVTYTSTRHCDSTEDTHGQTASYHSAGAPHIDEGAYKWISRACPPQFQETCPGGARSSTIDSVKPWFALYLIDLKQFIKDNHTCQASAGSKDAAHACWANS